MSQRDRIRFQDWIFEADFAVACSSVQPPVRFTRQEQAVLARLARQPGHIITREQLLDSLDPDGSGVGQRSVDFVVNRLRRKLHDDARNPRFIATRYGEGYVWLIKGRAAGNEAMALRIESVHGVAHPRDSGIATVALRELANQLGERLQWRVVLPASLGLSHPLQRRSADVRFAMDVSVLEDATHLHVACGIRDGRTDAAVRSYTRHFLLREAIGRMPELAAEVVSMLWSSMTQEALDEPTRQPLYITAHEAGLLLSRSPQYWLEMEERILQARRAHPDDARLRILWAANRHAHLLLGFGSDEAATTRLFGEYENLIEAEVMQALPGVSASPAYQLTAAMLLLTLARDHHTLAEELIDKALWNDAPFASVLCLRARLWMCRGDLEQALSYLDRGLEMATPASEFHIYLLVMKLKALVAGGNRAAMPAVERALYGVSPKAMVDVGLQAAAADAPLSAPLQQVLVRLGLQRVRQLLRHHYHIVVRPMQLREHRMQLMRGPLAHARRMFGNEVVADEIAHDLPELTTAIRSPDDRT